MSQRPRRGKNRNFKSQALPKPVQNLQCAAPTTPLQAAMQGISLLLNTHLTTTELDICIELLKLEVHPKALADVVLRLIEARKKEPDPADQ